MTNGNSLFGSYYSIRKEHGISFVNDDKILKIISFWFNYFFYIADNFRNKNLTLSNLDKVAVKQSIFYAVNLVENNSQLKFFNNRKRTVISWIIMLSNKFVINLYNPVKGLLPGGLSGSRLDRLRYRLLMIKAQSANFLIDNEFKVQFFTEAEKYFSSDLQLKLLKELLPDIFFAHSMKRDYHFPSSLKGAPICFLDNSYSYIKILFSKRKVELTGIQHGASYGEWNNNPFEEFDLSISDKYYGWGLFEKNIIQNRYHYLVDEDLSSEKKVLWIGRDNTIFNGTEAFSFPASEDHLNEISHIKFFVDEFKGCNIVFRRHPRNGHPVYDKIFGHQESMAASAEGLITNSKLVILDCLSHTLMYYCIYFNIPFVIVLNVYPAHGLSEKGLDFYNMLQRNNILISKADPEPGLTFIRSYLDGSLMEKDFFNEEVKEYFLKHFTGNTTIRDI